MRTKLRDGERLIFETRAHWITVVKPFFVFLAAVVLFVLSFVLVKEQTGISRAAQWACGNPAFRRDPLFRLLGMVPPPRPLGRDEPEGRGRAGDLPPLLQRESPR